MTPHSAHPLTPLPCPSVAIEARVMVTCGVCKLQYDASARTGRDIKARRVQPRCDLHRGRRREENTRVAEMRRYWLDRFTLDEIVEMAVALFPRPSQRQPGPVQVLTASGAPPGPVELGGKDHGVLVVDL